MYLAHFSVVPIVSLSKQRILKMKLFYDQSFMTAESSEIKQEKALGQEFRSSKSLNV